MKSRIWRMAGVGLLCVSVSAQVLADERDERRPPQQGAPSGGQREHAPEGRGENNQGHPANVPNRPQPVEQQPRPQNEVIRGENSRQFEHNGQNPAGQWQNHPQHDANQAVRPAPQPQQPQQPQQLQQPQQPQQQQPRPAPNLPIQGARTPCARPRSHSVATIRTFPGATTTTRIGKRVAQARGPIMVVPMTIAGRAVLTVMAMAGALGRSIAPGT